MRDKSPLFAVEGSPNFSLGALRQWLELVRTIQDTGVSRTDHAKKSGQDAEQVREDFRKIELDADIFLLARTITSRSMAGVSGIAEYPEDEARLMEAYSTRLSEEGKLANPLPAGAKSKVVAGLPRRKVSSEVTLDGEIWAEFAEAVLLLYAMSRSMTGRQVSSGMGYRGKLWASGKTFITPEESATRKAAELPGPDAPSGDGTPAERRSRREREDYLGWLKEEVARLQACEAEGYFKPGERDLSPVWRFAEEAPRNEAVPAIDIDDDPREPVDERNADEPSPTRSLHPPIPLWRRGLPEKSASNLESKTSRTKSRSRPKSKAGFGIDGEE